MEAALGYLSRAAEPGCTQLAFVDDPHLASLHGDPRFEAMASSLRPRHEEAR